MDKKHDSPIWIVLNFLAVIVMIFGIVAGIIIIVKMAPPAEFSTVIQKYNLNIDNPLRWVYGFGSMILGLVLGFLLFAVAQLAQTVEKLKTNE